MLKGLLVGSLCKSFRRLAYYSLTRSLAKGQAQFLSPAKYHQIPLILSNKMADATNEEGKPLSKNALKKLEKERLKAEKKAEKKSQLEEEAAKQSTEDVSKGRYGDMEMVQSKEKTKKVWTDVCKLDLSKKGERVLVRARLHTSRGTGKQCFIMLRQRQYSIQALVAVSENISKQMVKYTSNIAKESIVDVEGTIVAVDQKITSASQQDVEIQIEKVTLF
ncbi:aspartate--tRNA ligase, cytoplasmic-like [Hydractinia symbiolongicarpus]|uniref:aspartate--tRNA ligase, cytoplasmic-like n=1 Tax=Hydractinia symbiolongicarpus TaxID=13093 RepID=UPI00254B2E70|nr:aspartate--tRNA ligase, cytoplasmic-like [Hydractinia symbiolongicarpus]